MKMKTHLYFAIALFCALSSPAYGMFGRLAGPPNCLPKCVDEERLYPSSQDRKQSRKPLRPYNYIGYLNNYIEDLQLENKNHKVEKEKLTIEKQRLEKTIRLLEQKINHIISKGKNDQDNNQKKDNCYGFNGPEVIEQKIILSSFQKENDVINKSDHDNDDEKKDDCYDSNEMKPFFLLKNEHVQENLLPFKRQNLRKKWLSSNNQDLQENLLVPKEENDTYNFFRNYATKIPSDSSYAFAHIDNTGKILLSYQAGILRGYEVISSKNIRQEVNLKFAEFLQDITFLGNYILFADKVSMQVGSIPASITISSVRIPGPFQEGENKLIPLEYKGLHVGIYYSGKFGYFFYVDLKQAFIRRISIIKFTQERILQVLPREQFDQCMVVCQSEKKHNIIKLYNLSVNQKENVITCKHKGNLLQIYPRNGQSIALTPSQKWLICLENYCIKCYHFAKKITLTVFYKFNKELLYNLLPIDEDKFIISSDKLELWTLSPSLKKEGYVLQQRGAINAGVGISNVGYNPITKNIICFVPNAYKVQKEKPANFYSLIGVVPLKALR